MSVFKIIYLQVKFLALQRLAYRGNNALNIISTTVYTTLFIIFVVVIFRNTDMIGPYTKDAILFLTLLGQISFYFITATGYTSAIKLAESINSGGLDYVFTKPVRHLPFVTFEGFDIITMLFDGFPVIIVASVINWSLLSFTIPSLAIGILLFVLGLVMMYSIVVSLGCLAFWTGRSKNSIDVYWGLMHKTEQPIAALSTNLVLASLVVIPAAIPVSLAGSIMIGVLSPNLLYTLFGLGSTIFWLAVLNIIWSKGQRRYVSASS